MTMEMELKHFCIYEYFLDGHFCKCEQVNEHYLPVAGDRLELVGKDGQIIPAQVTETEEISASEYRIMLVSTP